ncbi:MAG TPA: RNA methyltransferase [Pyrinomonadaceae bacterium]|nr:RNA methyltransferase [Pyrinomonadaceae bacterium]
MRRTITSRDNSLLRLARSVRDGKSDEFIFVEGLRLCEEAVRSRLEITAVIFSNEIADKPRAAAFLEEVEALLSHIDQVNEKLLASISYTKTPQGIILLARRPASGRDLLIKDGVQPLLALLHGVNNPVNVGAILRSAEAAGATAVIVTANTADPYSPKSLRGAMGSAFRLPIWFGPSFEEAITWCRARGVRLVSADPVAQSLYTEVDWRSPIALVVGSEASGLTDEETSATDLPVRIPMQGSVESLNVAVATGILLYEAARQRGLASN